MVTHIEEAAEAALAVLESAGAARSGASVVVAVSGGADSAALLHLLATHRVEWGVRLTCAHLNHGFRGPEAEADADYVRLLCDSLEVPVVCDYADVPAMRRRRHLSAQAAARVARFDFLRRVASEAGAGYIALGHTRDDRIETVLLNILRGSGLDGLAVMPASDPPLLRPIIALSRAQTAEYCASHGLEPRQDSSNANLNYRRNRVRAELLPHLTSYYNQCVGDALLRLSDLAAEDTALLNEMAGKVMAGIAVRTTEERVTLDTAGLRALHPALVSRVIRHAIRALRGNLADIDRTVTERILTAVRLETSGTIRLPQGGAAAVSITIGTECVEFRTDEPAREAVPWSVSLPTPGRARAPHGAIVESCIAGSLWEAFSVSERQGDSLVFRLADTALPLTVRSWMPGDRMRPRGLGGTKKLQDLFTDRKVPGPERGRFPVLVDAADRAIAVLGLHAGESAIIRDAEAGGTADESADYIVVTWSFEAS